MPRRIAVFLAGAIFAAALFAAVPVSAASKICKTPDGFVVADGKGIGGTGSPEERGIGGTGIRADIGIYGRITGFGSICVNGMRIRYGDATPVSDMGEIASVDHLQIGQVVAVQAYPDGEGYSARHIQVEQSVAGRISSLDADGGIIVVRRQTVLANRRNKDVLAQLREGDSIAVSGLRRADGIIVAGYIKKISPDAADSRNRPVSFGPDVKAFAVQGYVQKIGKDGVAHLAGGMDIVLPDSATLSAGQRILAFGGVDEGSVYRAENIVVEQMDFPVIIIPTLIEKDGEAAPALMPDNAPPEPAPSLPPMEIPGTPIETPSLPIEVPALPTEVPSLPVDVPALPVDIPVLPVEVPLPPVDIPIVPDLPLTP